MVERICPECGQPFIVEANSRQIYCSSRCQRRTESYRSKIREEQRREEQKAREKAVRHKKYRDELAADNQEARYCGMSYGKWRSYMEQTKEARIRSAADAIDLCPVCAGMLRELGWDVQAMGEEQYLRCENCKHKSWAVAPYRLKRKEVEG